MKHLLTRGSTAVLIAATAFSAACSNDPTSPKAPSTARTPSSMASVRSNYVGSTALGTPVRGPVVDTGGASTNSGYLVSWSRDGQTAPSGAVGLRTPSGQ